MSILTTKYLILVIAILLSLQNPCHGSNYYQVINGYLCITAAFVEIHPESLGATFCAVLCNRNQRCQAFSTTDGPCQLFVFDKCSKSVRDCSCSRRGQVFVKQQPRLQPGALCPSGYGDDLCGVKYKLINDTGIWWSSKAKAESEKGLVIMADVIDDTEMSHVDMLYSKYISGDGSFWLGGYQTPGSPEPAGGWYWVGCNITVDSSLWTPGEPNNHFDGEDVIGRSWERQGLNDFADDDASAVGVLCECVSPFD